MYIKEGNGNHYPRSQYQARCRIWRPLLNKSALLVLAIMTGLAVKSQFDGPIIINIETDASQTTKSSLELTLERQELRMKTLQKACSSLKFNISENSPQKVCANTFVDTERKFIYCFIHKVSSSSIKKALVNSTGKGVTDESQMHINDNRWLSKFGLKQKCLRTDQNVNDHISEYFKFLVVRHPLKRLLSGYRDKFLGKHPDNIKTFQKKIGTNIVRKYRSNPSNKSLTYGNDVTFEEFLRYVIDTRRSPNSHWRTFWDSCHPCENSFNFIAHLETLDDDMYYILKTISKIPVPIPQNSRNLVAPGRTDEVFKESYRKIPQSIMDSIKEQFHNDFLVFGYDPDVYKK